MPAHKGNAITLTWGGSVVAGVREKGITLNGEAIDVSSDEDSGWRTLLTVSGDKSIDLALSGITKSAALKNDYFAGTRTKTVILTWPDGAQLSFTGFLGTYSETGPYADADTFECTLMSSGAPTYTPA